jgi:hypothetical protein
MLDALRDLLAELLARVQRASTVRPLTPMIHAGSVGVGRRQSEWTGLYSPVGLVRHGLPCPVGTPGCGRWPVRSHPRPLLWSPGLGLGPRLMTPVSG